MMLTIMVIKMTDLDNLAKEILDDINAMKRVKAFYNQLETELVSGETDYFKAESLLTRFKKVIENA